MPPRGGIDLHGDDELAGAELALEERLVLGLGRRDDELALAHDERRDGASALVDGGADGGDLGRRGAAAAADDSRAELLRVRGEVGEVLGRRMREDDPAPGQAREADVRHGHEWLSRAAHLLDRPERRLQAEPVVGAQRGHVLIRQGCGGVARRDAAERVRVLVEREQRDDRERGHAAHRIDRREELRELVEGLDDEQVDAAALEQLSLLGERGTPVVVRGLCPPGRSSLR